MKSGRIINFFFSVLSLILYHTAYSQNGLQIVEGPSYSMDCDSNCTMLHANFPKPLKTNQYIITSLPFSPLPLTGNTINMNDDKFSNAIPLGFDFCFFENVYNACFISDNGSLTFNPVYANGNCNNNTQQLLPYFNSTFPDNAIFFLFMDLAPSLGGTIKYAGMGVAPFRKLVITYQNMKLFGATCSNTLSTFQVVLHESTNIIDIHIVNKTTCDSNPLNYSNYATIGVQNIGATIAFTAAGYHSSIFTLANQSFSIKPAGPLNYQLTWKDASNNTIAINADSIYFCPPVIPYNKIRAEINFYCPNQTFKDSVILTKNLPQIDSLILQKPLCSNDSSGVIMVMASGSTPPLTYAINNGVFSSLNVFTNLSSGFYYVSVKDANGCKKDSLVHLTNQYNILVVTDSIIKPTCPDSNGKIVVHAVNGVPPYSIAWNNGSFGSTITGLTAGIYTAIVTDVNGCTAPITITLEFEGLPSVQNVMITKPVCHDSTGKIQITPTGGTMPYHYLWSTGDTTQNLLNIPAGQYLLTITDANGCSFSPMYQVVDTLTTLTYDTVLANTTCNLSNGVALVIASGGLLPYTYHWMPGGQITATATGLGAGTYICTTQDANGCVALDTFVITPSLALSNSISPANANCDSSNGKIYLNTVFNWTGWVDTLWSTGDTGSVITGLAPGTYWVKTTDSLGCTITDTILLSNDGKPYLSLLSYLPPKCFGDSSGTITLSGISGTAPYKYSLDGINFTSFAQINNIAGGTYTIYITDANSCPNDTIVFFTQPTEIISTYTADTLICFDDKTSTLELFTSGGFPPYAYSFNQSPFSAQYIFTQLSQGEYTVTVKDSNDCLKNVLVTVPGPTAPLEVLMDKKDVPCFENNTGYIKLMLQGGWQPYVYSWSNGFQGLNMDQIDETHVSFTVMDSKGCEVTKAIDVEQLLCCKAIVPNAFSPNGDQHNETLRVIPISEVQSVKFNIFDRWGKLIFSTKNLTEDWDGKYLGRDCDMDVYFYYLEYSCPFQKEKVIQKGDITLVR